MKKSTIFSIIFFIHLAGLSSFAADEPSLNKLWQKYADVEQELAAYERLSEEMAKPGTPIERFFELTERIEALKLELERLKDALIAAGKKHGELPGKLPGFEIKASCDTYDGPPLKGAVQNGDILAFQADVKHPKSDPPLLSSLYWQVYDTNGKPIEGLKKQVQAYESDVTKNYRFRFSLDNMDNGSYTMALTHFLANDPEVKTQASYRFRLFQQVRIDRLVVTTDSKDQTHKNVLNHNQAAYLYGHYILGKGIDEVEVTLTAREKKSGMVIGTATEEKRPRKGKTAKQRAGLGLKKGTFPPDTEAIFEFSVKPPGGKAQTASIPFMMAAYEITLIMPDELESGESADFAIKVPEMFKKPYTVTVDQSGSVSVGHTPGRLSGTISGIAEDYAESGWIYATVTDAEGRVGKTSERVTIQPEEKEVVVAKVETPSTPRPSYIPSTPSYSGIEKTEPPSTTTPPVSKPEKKPQPKPAVDYVAKGRERYLGLISRFFNAVPSCIDSQAKSAGRQHMKALTNNRSTMKEVGMWENWDWDLKKDKVINAWAGGILADIKKQRYDNCDERWVRMLYRNGWVTYGEMDDTIAAMKRNSQAANSGGASGSGPGTKGGCAQWFHIVEDHSESGGYIIIECDCGPYKGSRKRISVGKIKISTLRKRYPHMKFSSAVERQGYAYSYNGELGDHQVPMRKACGKP